MLDATDNQYRLPGKRMEWISDYRLERQTPGIMNLLSTKVVLRILSSPSLPPAARDALIAYIDDKNAGIDDKNAGAFGHGERERRKFATRLSDEVQS